MYLYFGATYSDSSSAVLSLSLSTIIRSTIARRQHAHPNPLRLPLTPSPRSSNPEKQPELSSPRQPRPRRLFVLKQCPHEEHQCTVPTRGRPEGKCGYRPILGFRKGGQAAADSGEFWWNGSGAAYVHFFLLVVIEGGIADVMIENEALQRQNSDKFAPPSTDNGQTINAQWPMALSRNRYTFSISIWNMA